MILRKPYAFLIKNFKRIHFILFLLNTALSYYVYKIFKFYIDYESTGKILYVDDLVTEYIKPIMFILIGLSILMLIIILILLYQKNKPVRLYIVMLVYYIVLIVFLSIDSNYLNILQIEGLEPQLVRIFKDLNFLALLGQTIFSIILLVRAVGFDIKKFDFGTDIVELEIDVTDNEEIELTSGIDIDNLSGKSRKRAREFKYFYLENRGIIIGGIVILILSLSAFLYIKTNIVDVNYKEGDTLIFSKSEIVVNKSYITNLNYKGENVSPTGYTFVIVDFTAKNITNSSKSLLIDNIRLETNKVRYNINTRKYESFIDIGTGYTDQKIVSYAAKTYIVVFLVKEEDITDDMVFMYADTNTISGTKVTINYKNVDIIPTELNTIKNIDIVNIENNMYYGLSLLKETNLKINSIQVGNRIEYTLNNKSLYLTSLNNTILKINYDFAVDSSISYVSSFFDFINKYSKLSYTYDDKIYFSSISNLTPSKYTDNDIFLEVNKQLEEAESIILIFTVRNVRYTYKLK